ncbi:MAG: hypothetical protein JWL96_2150 [Sphingomonas bacterium]|nr:hypothetical protein [Sphingomonas bacterium]
MRAVAVGRRLYRGGGALEFRREVRRHLQAIGKAQGALVETGGTLLVTRGGEAVALPDQCEDIARIETQGLIH